MSLHWPIDPCFANGLASEICRVKPGSHPLLGRGSILTPAGGLLGFAISLFRNGLLKLGILCITEGSRCFTARRSAIQRMCERHYTKLTPFVARGPCASQCSLDQKTSNHVNWVLGCQTEFGGEDETIRHRIRLLTSRSVSRGDRSLPLLRRVSCATMVVTEKTGCRSD